MKSSYEAKEENRFTSREEEIVLLISEGLTNQQIAQRLFLSEKTVKNHISNVFKKLGAKHRSDVVVYFYEKKIKGLERVLGMSIRELCENAHENAKNKGFWEKEESVDRKMEEFGFLDEEREATRRAFQSQKLMLIVSELAEAVEALRKGDTANFGEELADVMIRLGDFCGGYNIDIESHVKFKMEQNKARPKLHGKKF